MNGGCFAGVGKCLLTRPRKLILSFRAKAEPESRNLLHSWFERTGPGHGPMFKYVRRWSNLIQISAFVKVRSMDLPKSMRIFVH